MDKNSTTEMNEEILPLKSTSITEYETSVIEMSIDCWKLQKLFLKITRQLNAGEQGRYESQLRYFCNNNQAILDRFGIRFVNLEGQPYDGGMAVIALNIAEFEPEDKLIVDQMTEPVIMSKEGLKKMGTVLLRRLT